MKTKVGILMGGNSPEHEVSLMSGNEVFKYIDKSKYEPIKMLINKDGSFNFTIEDIKFQDVIFIALHGTGGEDGRIQGFLETLNVKYTGPNVDSSVLAMDKAVSRALWQEQGLPIVPYETIENIDQCRKHPFPFVLKPNKQGSSVGVFIVAKHDQLKNAYREVSHYGEVILEPYISGQSELTVGFLDGKALTPVEIIPASKFYDYEAKYLSEKTKYLIPPKLPKRIVDYAKEISISACNALKIDSFSRVDILIKDDEPLLLEVNTIPGLTSHSLLPKAAEADGISFPSLIDKMIQIALR